eukprot:Tbor_TRINITY_DN5314_c2_g1::TRINITY_DN5314_c2_g1_i1::g.5070::m.5070
MTSDNRGEEACMAALSTLNITPQTTLTHNTVNNIEDWTSEINKISPEILNTNVLAKNVFLKGKKGELLLLFALGSTKTDLKVVAKEAGVGSVRMAATDIMFETIGVGEGCVTPLALINDKDKKVIVIIDSNILSCGKPIFVHPCRNDKSVVITSDELLRYIEHTGHKFIKVDFSNNNNTTTIDNNNKTNN